jgi:hypothetical protein
MQCNSHRNSLLGLQLARRSVLEGSGKAPRPGVGALGRRPRRRSPCSGRCAITVLRRERTLRRIPPLRHVSVIAGFLTSAFPMSGR